MGNGKGNGRVEGGWDWGGCGIWDVPGVCDDDVVEWRVFFAEAGEADSEDHSGEMCE